MELSTHHQPCEEPLGGRGRSGSADVGFSSSRHQLSTPSASVKASPNSELSFDIAETGTTAGSIATSAGHISYDSASMIMRIRAARRKIALSTKLAHSTAHASEAVKRRVCQPERWRKESAAALITPMTSCAGRGSESRDRTDAPSANIRDVSASSMPIRDEGEDNASLALADQPETSISLELVERFFSVRRLGGSRGCSAPRANETSVPIRPTRRRNRSSVGGAPVLAPPTATFKSRALVLAEPPQVALKKFKGKIVDSRLRLPLRSTASSASTAAASAAREATPEAPQTKPTPTASWYK
mmetsp:Transcript_25431/g.77174  ORF Transcript_25431/g.77174 Transcript_25431/m.77174 type:complete len:301 (-) Transcript_25431:413-1315(-)